MHSKSFREKAILPKKAARFCELLKESNRLMLCLLEPCEIVPEISVQLHSTKSVEMKSVETKSRARFQGPIGQVASCSNHFEIGFSRKPARLPA